MRLNTSFAMLTCFLSVCLNRCSELLRDVGKLNEISTTFRNSMKIAWNFLFTSMNSAIITRLNKKVIFCKVLAKYARKLPISSFDHKYSFKFLVHNVSKFKLAVPVIRCNFVSNWLQYSDL